MGGGASVPSARDASAPPSARDALTPGRAPASGGGARDPAAAHGGPTAGGGPAGARPEYFAQPMSTGGVAGIPSPLPRELLLCLGPEALVLADAANKTELAHIAYHTIMSWGYTATTFQFKVMPPNAAPGQEPSTVCFHSQRGSQLADHLLSHIRSLMRDMERRAMSNQEFEAQMAELRQASPDEALALLRTMCAARSVTVRQAVLLLRLLGEQTPFDKLEAAVVLHERILAKDSFQLLLDEFPDKLERENLVHRLRLDPAQFIMDPVEGSGGAALSVPDSAVPQSNPA